MFMRMNKKGQSTLEYGILVAVVVGALILMSIYMKRGLQGRLKSSTDDVGDQFSPYNTTSNYHMISNTSNTENLTFLGQTTTGITSDIRERTGSETVERLSNERW